MDEQLTISTPEQVAFHYEMAGIGSRFLASLLDHLILGVTLGLVLCAAQAIVTIAVISNGESSQGAGYLLAAVLVIIFFLIFWGYFVLFETIWNGQTPGKRAGRLRVIRRDGQPVRAGEVMIRNIVRLVDLLPGFYGVGLVTMFIDKDARRLGDLAAGTIVVREGEQTRLRDVQVQVPQAGPSVQQAYASAPLTAYEQAQYPQYASQRYNRQGYKAYPAPAGYGVPAPSMPKYDPLPGISLRDVTQEDYQLVREMLQRISRGEMSRARAEELAHRLAYGVAGRMGQDFREWQGQGWDALVFLQSVMDAKEARE